uniref:SJCHGC07624 protein n=1 Tax=Schistosoma japonicum TaxID=6182 RepID=Q5BRR4_SCHJA|nr:SJCHGC07624 protein [Schistosoma japonicum]
MHRYKANYYERSVCTDSFGENKSIMKHSLENIAKYPYTIATASLICIYTKDIV